MARGHIHGTGEPAEIWPMSPSSLPLCGEQSMKQKWFCHSSVLSLFSAPMATTLLCCTCLTTIILCSILLKQANWHCFAQGRNGTIELKFEFLEMKLIFRPESIWCLFAIGPKKKNILKSLKFRWRMVMGNI